jgi:uncharacterized protein
MSLNIGEINHLIVNRKTDIGYMLESDDEQVFLHFNESLHQDLKPNDKVDAFLYYDNKGRLAATLKMPYVTVTKPGFLSVSDTHPTLGVFMDMGIAKELLLSADDLPLDYSLWPEKGDVLYVGIKIKGKLVAKILSKEDVRLRPQSTLELMKSVSAHVQKIGVEGINLLTDEGHSIFVHHTMIKTMPRLGQEVSVKVTFHSEKGYTGSMTEQKEVAIYEDANTILSYIIRNGDMALNSDSSPEAIYETFKMSKKAFKRALGHLYKERKIDFKDDFTILVKSSI